MKKKFFKVCLILCIMILMLYNSCNAYYISHNKWWNGEYSPEYKSQLEIEGFWSDVAKAGVIMIVCSGAIWILAKDKDVEVKIIEDKEKKNGE